MDFTLNELDLSGFIDDTLSQFSNIIWDPLKIWLKFVLRGYYKALLLENVVN